MKYLNLNRFIFITIFLFVYNISYSSVQAKIKQKSLDVVIENLVKNITIETSNVQDDLKNIQDILDKANFNLINEQSIYLIDLVKIKFPNQVPVLELFQTSAASLKSEFEKIPKKYVLDQIFASSTLINDFETKLNLFQRKFRTSKTYGVSQYKFDLETLINDLRRITINELKRIETSVFQNTMNKINELSIESNRVKFNLFNSLGYSGQILSFPIKKAFDTIYAQLNSNRDKFIRDLRFLIERKSTLGEGILSQAFDDLLWGMKSYQRKGLQTDPKVQRGEFAFTIEFQDVAKALIESSEGKKKRQAVSCASKSFNLNSFTANLKSLSAAQPIIGKYVSNVDVQYTCVNPEIIIDLEFLLTSADEHVYYLSVLDLLIEFLRDSINSITEPAGLGDFYFNPDTQITINGEAIYEIDGLVSRYILSDCLYNTRLITQNKETCMTEVTPQSINCGVLLDANGQPTSGRKKRITGGVETTANGYPWQVFIEDATDTVYCGGTLISNEWILTAAQCFDDQEAINPTFNFILGKHDLTQTETGEQTRTAALILRHPFFNYWTFSNDLVLVKLSSPVQFGQKINSICLKPDSPSALDTITVTGWGKTDSTDAAIQDKLLEATVTVQDKAQCVPLRDGLDKDPKSFCTIDSTAGSIKDICHGDEGGPAVKNDDGVFYLYGVSSKGKIDNFDYLYYYNFDTCSGVSSYFTDVSKFNNWIAHTISKQANKRTTTLPTQCGSTSTFDSTPASGNEAVPHSLPWMVAMKVNNIQRCSGVLIHRLWAVFSAHCFVMKEHDPTVIFEIGKHNLKQTELSQVRRRAADIIVHPFFNNKFGFNNIALVKFDKPVVFTTKIKPICLPSNSPTVGDTGYVVGWGGQSIERVDTKSEFPFSTNMDILNQVSVTLEAGSVCLLDQAVNTNKNPLSLCSGNSLTVGGQESCLNDRSGPLIIQSATDSLFYLTGLSDPFGKGLVESEYSSTDLCDNKLIFNDVYQYKTWIEQSIYE